MGKVFVLYNIMPEGTEYPIEKIQDAIPGVVPENVKIESSDIKPVAFGLKMIELALVMDDGEGLVGNIEDALNGIEGVQNVEVKDQTLV